MPIDKQNKGQSNSLSKISNMRTLLLSEKSEFSNNAMSNINNKRNNELFTTTNKNKNSYERIFSNELNKTCSPAKAFATHNQNAKANGYFSNNLSNLNNLNLNSSGFLVNKSDVKNSILSTETNLNSWNRNSNFSAKSRTSIEKLTTDFLKANGPNTSGNHNNGINYSSHVFTPQNASSLFDVNNISDRFYANKSGVKNGNIFLDNTKKFTAILKENPDIKDKIFKANGITNKSSGSTNASGHNIENVGLHPSSNNSSFNYNNTNAGKEINNFLSFNKNYKEKDLSNNFLNSPSWRNNPNGHHVDAFSNRNSLKNLKAIKNQLENLFDKNNKSDKGYNNAMENLCEFLNYKHKKTNGANNKHNDKSIKLMNEIKDMRYFILFIISNTSDSWFIY